MDIEVKDIRGDTKVIAESTFTKFAMYADNLLIWLDTGYQVRIRIKALQPIVDELVSKEVLNRLKGKEE